MRLLVLAALLAASACRPAAVNPGPAPQVLFRLDDVGMNHSVNMAIKQVAATGMPFSVSVLFACPWYQEAVEILKQNPHISVGVHLALNSEWKHYRWGPVLGAAAVPSLVDSDGYFVHSNETFRNMKYDLAEVERELTAQMERAVKSGLRIDYVDQHMGTARSTPELRAIVERLAAKYQVGISRYFGEDAFDLFATEPDEKIEALTRRLAALDRSRPTVIVVHVADDHPEMRVLFDMNYAPMNKPNGEPLTWVHRFAEFQMMVSDDLQRALRRNRVQPITYKDLVEAKGLAAMRSPRD